MVSRVLAAGGILLRRDGDGRTETCLVHRPKYDDWSFPKGKLAAGESFREAALREVTEETGYTCELGRQLHPVHYRDSQDRPKEVRYWVMRVVGGEGRFSPTREIDQIRWIEVREAPGLLSYRRDRELLEQATAASRPPQG